MAALSSAGKSCCEPGTAADPAAIRLAAGF